MINVKWLLKLFLIFFYIKIKILEADDISQLVKSFEDTQWRNAPASLYEDYFSEQEMLMIGKIISGK